MSDEVLAYAAYPSNAELIAAAARLGYLRRDWVTLDPTYDKGVFWRVFRPEHLVVSDVRPRRPEVARVNFREMPWASWSFDAVVFDPPYGLRGAVNETNGGYGLDAGYLAIQARHTMICEGIAECARVTRPRGYVLVKCQDQVCSGRVWWQTRIFADHAERYGLEQVDRLDMESDREQPERTRWACRACRKGYAPDESSVGPKHRCRHAREQHPAYVTDLHGEFDPAEAPWLEEIDSPQQHARNRPSSLLVFKKER